MASDMKSLIPQSSGDRIVPQGRVFKVEFLCELPNAAVMDEIKEWIFFGLCRSSMSVENPLSSFDVEAIGDAIITDTGYRNIVTERKKPGNSSVTLRTSTLKIDTVL